MKKNKFFIVCAALFMFATTAFAAENIILSGNIMEADGTTGQDTNTGSGIKTDHIQNSAITTGKMADGAVTSNKVADGAVTTGKIADGSVIDGKISGTISTSKLNVGTTSGTVAAGDHNHDSVYQKKYANVVVVAKSGGDYADPAAAINATYTWCPDPYWSQCLIKIMPGVYDVGSTAMNSMVDIEGSGESVTKIKGIGAPSPTSGVYAVLHQKSGTDVRNLTVESYGTGYTVGISSESNYGTTDASTKIQDVTVIISSPGNNQKTGIKLAANEVELTNLKVKLPGDAGGVGISVADGSDVKLGNVAVTVACNSSQPTTCYGIGISTTNKVIIGDSEITVKNCYPGNCGGIQAYTSNIMIRDTTITSPAVGVWSNSGSSFNIDHSTIYGGGTSLYYNGAIYVADSKVYGGVPTLAAPIPGILKCIGLYNDNYDPVTCP